MRCYNKSFLYSFLALVLVGFLTSAQAQDDVYYDPTTDAPVVDGSGDYADESNNVKRRYDGDDEDEYSYDDDYSYEYSSRIRRFHRPVVVYDYYDPFYVDLYHYDPYYLPGASIYVVNNDYWSYRQYRRWQRWNSWGYYQEPGYGYYGSPWSRPSWGYGGAWNNVYVYNNYYYDPYWTWNGYNPYYCPANSWSNNYYYYNNANNNYNEGGYQPKTYTGVRRHGTTVNPGYAQIVNNNKAERLSANDKSKNTIELRPRQNTRTPVQTTEAGKTTTTRPQEGRRPAVETAPKDGQSTRPVRVENDRPVRETAPATEARPSRRPATEPDVEKTPSQRPTAEPQREERPRTETPRTTPTREERPRTETPRRDRQEDYRRSDERPSRPSRDEARPEPTQRRSAEPSNERQSRPRTEEARTPRQESSRSNDSGSKSNNSSDKSSKASGGRGRN